MYFAVRSAPKMTESCARQVLFSVAPAINVSRGAALRQVFSSSRTTYSYNEHNQVATLTRPDTGVITFTYD